MSSKKQLEIDAKYLDLLGFTQSIYNGTRFNFTIVTYILSGQAPAAILLSQNIATKLPNDILHIYNLGISDEDARSLNAFCNNSKCSVIQYDLSQFPSYVTDEHMHAYRPLIIKDALTRSKQILFIENNIRFRKNNRDVYEALLKNAQESGVLGWTTRQAVSSRTHPKMFEYFQTATDSFLFLPMVSLDTVIFLDTKVVNEQILLPWIKCTLTMECIHPIGKTILNYYF